MPTVARFDGLRVVIYPNDHRPAHVHVVGAGREAVFELSYPDGPPQLRESFGFRYRDIRRVTAYLSKHVAELCRAWRKIHGDPQGI